MILLLQGCGNPHSTGGVKLQLVVCLWLMTAYSCSIIQASGHSLHYALHHFEVLHKHQIEHRDSIRGQRTLVVSTLNRTFELHLSPHQGLFSNGLTVNSIDAGGSMTTHALDISHFYTGKVADESESLVSAHLDQKEGILTASILTKTEHYFIEPSFRHFDLSHDFHMISYRRSDLKYNITQGGGGGSYCSTESHLPPVNTSPSVSLPKSSRFRRQDTPLTLDSCPMLLVATGRFQRAYSTGRNVENTILFMVQVIDSVDQHTFRPVEWDVDMKNYGLTIKNITVYEDIDTGPPYNLDRSGGWESSQMLQLFSHNNWSDFCLAHLFTFQQFTDDRVGVAYPASSKNLPGGICSEELLNFNGGSISTPNVGLSSFRGGGGRIMLLAEARLITAHEIGHNWGSEHDPTNTIGDPCNPDLSNSAGKFLMYPSLTDGTQPNNDNFSICSQNMISQVLRSKSPRCFVRGDVDQCGNYEVDDDGEECDAGLQGTLGLDSCCDSNCHLRPGKDCSDGNHICCTNCSVSDVEKVCRVFPLHNSQCKANVTCDGVRVTCPPDSNDLFVEVNSTCRGLGRCLLNGSVCNTSGVCLDPPPNPYASTVMCYDLCHLRGMQQCFCNNSNECNFCCQEVLSSDDNSVIFPCVPLAPVINLPDGASCLGGLCYKGTCTPITQDLVNRLFSLFTDISIDKFFQFLSENIVGSVLFIATVFWIIIGIPIHICDRRRFKRVREVVNELDEERHGNYNEDHYDHALLDTMALVTPEIDTSRTRKGLVRMGSLMDPPLRSFSWQYSMASGYAEDETILGRRLSIVLEQSKKLDPSNVNIMQHILLSSEMNSDLSDKGM